MKRLSVSERPGWKAKAEELGFSFHTMYGEPYWDETVCYAFTLQQIEADIEDPTTELVSMCYDVVERVVNTPALMDRLCIPRPFHAYIQNSWRNGEGELYGRFDLRYDGTGPAKLYEYNADTPTSLYETAFFQWLWLEEAMQQGIIPAGSDQFNSVQEHLIETFATMGTAVPLHLVGARDNEEDLGTVRYLQDCAVQAGVKTVFMHIDEIGFVPGQGFVDLGGQPIERLFKLYPWEWLFAEQFGAHLPSTTTQFIEPPWKAILSNKGILPLLWEMFPDHPNLLPAYFEDDPKAKILSDNYAHKPLFSREGENITLADRSGIFLESEGGYGDGPYIVQALCPPPCIEGQYPVIGSWVINGKACGIGMREDCTPITRNLSRFIPHFIEP